jgi:hypothetical protein
MTCATYVLMAAVAAADSSEFQTVAAGKGQSCQSAIFSPDGERIVALRRVNPVPTPGDPTYHVDIWKVADIDAFEGTATRTPPPAVTTELKDCHTAFTASFSKDGEVVVLVTESEMNGHHVQLSRGSKPVTPDEAKQAKDSGRRVTRFQRPVTLFLGHDDLVERRRWVDDHLNSRGNLSSKLIWFAAGRTVVDCAGGSDGVRLLDDLTGEAYDRLKFEHDRSNDPWNCLADAQITHVDARSCVIAAIARQRHAVWKLTADRKVTKLAEVQHAGRTNRVAVSPVGNVVAIAPLSSDYKWGLNGPPVAEPGAGGLLELWDVESRKPQSKLLADDLTVLDMKFTPDGKRLVTFVIGVISVEHVPRPNRSDAHNPRWTGEGIVWDVPTGRKLLRWPLGKVTPATIIDLSPDGRRLLTNESSDEEYATFRIRLWDLDRRLKAEGLSPSRPRL